MLLAQLLLRVAQMGFGLLSRNGVPAKLGFALKSARLLLGHQKTLCPFTFISYAILPTEGNTDTSVWCAASVSRTTSKPSTVVFPAE